MTSTPLLRESLPPSPSGAVPFEPDAAVTRLGNDLLSLKEVFAGHLQQEYQRTVLFSSLDALQTVLSSIPEVISVETRVEMDPLLGQEDFDRLRLRQMRLIRIAQGLLIMSILILAILNASVATIVSAMLVLMLVLAQIAVADLDPYKRMRPISLDPMGGVAGLLHSMIFRARKSLPKPEVRAKASVLLDDQRLRSTVRVALGHLDRALDAAAPPPPTPQDGTLETALLRLIQKLTSKAEDQNPTRLHQTLRSRDRASSTPIRCRNYQRMVTSGFY